MIVSFTIVATSLLSHLHALAAAAAAAAAAEAPKKKAKRNLVDEHSGLQSEVYPLAQYFESHIVGSLQSVFFFTQSSVSFSFFIPSKEKTRKMK